MSENISLLLIAIGEAGADALDLVNAANLPGLRSVLMDSSGTRLDASHADVKILLPKDESGDRAGAIEGETLQEAMRGVDVAFVIASDQGAYGLSDIPSVAKVGAQSGAAVAAFLMQYHPEDEDGGAWADADDEYRERVIEALRSTDEIFYLPYSEPGAAERTVCKCLAAIYGSLLAPGLSEISTEDIVAAISGAGGSVVGVGEASGQNAAIEAARDALKSSTLDRNINGSTRVSVFIVSGPDTTRDELEEAVVIIAKAADDDVRGIMWGHTVDPAIGSGVRVVMLASNFDDMKDRREEMRRQVIGFLDRINYRYSDAVPDEIKFGINLVSKVSSVKITMSFSNDGYITLTRLPIKALPEYRDEVMRFITMANNRLRIGNFDIDLTDGEISFRTYTCYEGMVVLSDAVISRSFEIGASVVDEYGNALMDVIMGYTDAETALAREDPDGEESGGDDVE